VYRKVAEAKFLAKACVIVTDGIRKREAQEPSRQVLPRACARACERDMVPICT